ncbi:MAG: LemA family protein, partial [Mycoplasmataceae bacterium]|nr:LemA family protein [Mycoplasmataceae bacterium]
TQTSIKFEKGLLTDITSLRNINHFSAQDKNTQKLDYVAHGLIGQLENYPNLKTTDTIRELMQAANIIENEIAASRRLYNQIALEFNQSIQTWPGTVVSTRMKLHSFALFAASEAERQDVSLKMSA